MKRCAPRSSQNLFPTTQSRGSNNGIRVGSSNGGKQNQLPDCHTQFVIVFFIAKGAGHTATTRRNHADVVIFWQSQYKGGALRSNDGLLVAMTV